MFECGKVRGLLEDRTLPKICCACTTITKFSTVIQRFGDNDTVNNDIFLPMFCFLKESSLLVPEIFYQTDKKSTDITKSLYVYFLKKCLMYKRELSSTNFNHTSRYTNFKDTGAKQGRFFEWLY